MRSRCHPCFRRQETEGAEQREAHGPMVVRAPRLHWCLGPQQDYIPTPCSWGTSRETPPAVRIGMCSLVRKWSLGLSSSLSVCRLVWQQLRSEAQSRNQSTLSARKILTQRRERRERLTWPSPGSLGGHSGLRESRRGRHMSGTQ